MPELPEVEVTRLGLLPHIQGASITQIRVGKPLRWELGHDPEQLVGQTIHHIRRRAKYLLFELDDGILMVHLGMSGRLVYYQQSTPPTKHDHFDITTTQGLIRLHDPRRFGAVVWTPAEDIDMGKKLLGSLGMEPLDSSFSTAEFVRQIKEKKTAIKQVLLSGKVVVGVGNIYACEVLFAAGIHPEKSANKISSPKLIKLATSIQNILQEAITYGGSTLKDFRSAEGDHGLFQLHAKVYGKAGKPCTVCGTPIQVMQQHQRSTYFCPNCQKKS